MKILVTGATGFVGSHLCERLVEKGHQVYAQARNENKFKQFNVAGTLVHGKLVHDSNHPWIDQLPEDLDVVVHTAGIVHSFEKEDFYRVNTHSTAQLIKDLKSRYKNLKFVLVSSLAALGPTENDIPRKEEHRPSPTSEYGKSKLEAERVLFEESPDEWNKIVIRPPMVIGPRDPAVLDIFKMVKSGVVLMAGMNGKQKRYSYVCVYDLVEIITKALESDEITNETFLVGHDRVITQDELISTIKDKMNKRRTVDLTMPMPMIRMLAHTLEKLHKFRPINARLTPDKIHELEPQAWTCSSKKSQEKLKMEYNWDLEDTIEVTLEDYQNRGWL